MSTDRKDNASAGAPPSVGPLHDESNFSRPLSFGLQSMTTTTITAGNPPAEEKGIKKRFWSLRNKKKDDSAPLSQRRSQASLTSPTSAPTSAPAPTISNPAMSPTSPLHSPGSTTASTSPNRLSHQPLSSPSSPGRQLYSPAQRPLSTASSQIFERNVQEDVASAQLSPAIPAHIITENHIPPVLEASSEAITDSHLDPDSVEIVTHGSHQAASATVSGGLGEHSLASSFYDDASATTSAHPLSPPAPLSSFEGDETATSNYGNLDAGDIRRLSFISFADVVHAENAESHADLSSSGYLGGTVPGSSAAGYTPSSAATARGRANRSPSPIRSPVSSHGFSTSPPTSVSPSFKGLEVSPVRAPTGTASPPLASATTAPVQPKPLNLSPAPASSPPLSASTSGHLLSPGLSPGLPGELQVETMRQIIRRSGSQDFSAAKAGGSQPLSTAGSETCESGPVKAP